MGAGIQAVTIMSTAEGVSPAGEYAGALFHLRMASEDDMNRTIIRKISFTADEVKEALIDYLEKNSQKAPLVADDAVSFELTKYGAVMEWTDAQSLELS